VLRDVQQVLVLKDVGVLQVFKEIQDFKGVLDLQVVQVLKDVMVV
jgi:hypothetical protein